MDANGAGDAFAAAFLVAWTAGKSDGECLADGTVAGAYAGTRTVGADAFVTAAELERRSEQGDEQGDGWAAEQ
jgi:acarbose 7IV-phosphotransferase